VCKKLIKNAQPFGKNFQKTLGGRFFLTHTVCTIQHGSVFLSNNCKWKNVYNCVIPNIHLIQSGAAYQHTSDMQRRH